MANFLKKFSKEIWGIIALFLIWRIGLFIVAYFGFFNFPDFPLTNFYNDLHPIFSMWMPFDVGWLTHIAQNGYSISNQAPAFFPLWPLLIFITGKMFFFIDIRIVAFILANLFTLGACLMLYKLVKLEFSDESTAYRSVKYLLIFPMSLFLATSYTEPLFLFLAISSFYLVRKNNLLVGSLAGMGAALTRAAGVVLFVPLTIETAALTIQDKSSGIWRKIIKFIPLLFIPLGTILYMIYLKIITGDWLAFLHAQSSGWTRNIGLGGLQSLWINVKTLFGFHFFLPGGAYITSFVQAGIFIIFIVIIILAYKKIRPSYLIYSLLVLLLPLAGGNLVSMNRYVLAAFPVFMILGFWGKIKWVDELITITFILLLGLFTAMFVNGYWVG